MDKLLQMKHPPIRQLPDIVIWAEKNFFVGKDEPIRLHPVQKTVLREMFRQDSDGHFVYRDGLYSTIKKSGKTTIAALVMQWAAQTWGDFKEIYHLGNKLQQAQSRAFKLVRYSILWGNNQAEWDITATKLTYLPSQSFIQALPVNAAGEAGGHQCLTTWTEAHGFTHQENERMWEELQPIPTEELSFRFVESYAGYKGESNLLESIWERALQGERIHQQYPLFGNGRLIGYIDQGTSARRMPWQDANYYAEAEASSLPHEYQRIHLNQWVSSQHAFINIELFDQLKHALTLDADMGVMIGVDASVSGDCSAIVAVTMIDTIPHEVMTMVFEPPAGGTIDYSQTIEPALRHLFAQFRVIGIAYDPYQLHDLMTRLTKEFAPYDEHYKRDDKFFYPFNQGGERLHADTHLMNIIRQGLIAHTGNQTLRQHVLNSDAKASGDKAFRIVKRQAKTPIDAVIALSMAIWRMHTRTRDQEIGEDYDSEASQLLNDHRG